MRTPDELRLTQLADFFGVTVEYMRRDNSTPESSAKSEPVNSEAGVSANEQTEHSRAERQSDFEPRPSAPSFPYYPFYRPPKPGQSLSDNTRSLCWLADRFFGDVREFGITIRLHPDDIDRIVARVLASKSLAQ